MSESCTVQKVLIALAAIDSTPYELGQFTSSKRKITKQYSSMLRKVVCEVMRMLKRHSGPKMMLCITIS